MNKLYIQELEASQPDYFNVDHYVEVPLVVGIETNWAVSVCQGKGIAMGISSVLGAPSEMIANPSPRNSKYLNPKLQACKQG